MKVFGITHISERDFPRIEEGSKVKLALLKVNYMQKVEYRAEDSLIGFSKSDGWIHRKEEQRKHQLWSNTFFVLNQGDEIILESFDSQGLEIILMKTDHNSENLLVNS